jgi:hypothetical protein
MSFSQRTLESSADDPPFAAALHELELETVEIRVETFDERGTGAPTEHADENDGTRRIATFDDHAVDSAHELDTLICDEEAAHRAQRRGAVVAAAVSICFVEHVCEEPDVAFLASPLGCPK